jgi:hypothetical protein
MFAPIIGLALATISGGLVLPPRPNAVALDRIASWVRSTERQRISVWTNHDDDPYTRGDEARVYFKAETDGYVTVLRVDTDGRTRILFPREPWEDNFARGGRTFEVLDRDQHAFQIDDAPGVGYIFAVSSPDPFQFDDFVRGDHWDYRLIAEGRIRGDPYVSLTEFASQIAPAGEYDYDIASYYVDQHYDYPRFLCYDCHSYVSYAYWDPYRYTCSRFRIVVYDDAYYYPYRYYRGRDVVIVRPYHPRPRYVFKDADGRDGFVTSVRQRPSDDGRRVAERDRTSADVGGRGSIPAPVDPRGRRTTGGGRDLPSNRPSIDGQGTPRRRIGEDNGNGTTDRPASPGTPEPRRKGDDENRSRPNILPRDNGRSESQGEERRRNPDSGPNPELRPVDPGQPNVLPPDRRSTDLQDGQSSRDSRSTDSRSESRRRDPGDQQRADPPHSQPDSRRNDSPRSDQPRSEPRNDPPRQEPRRAEPPPASRPQPSGEPQLRRRKP